MKTHPALDFLRRLADNNNRVWFAEHRSEYDDVRAQWLAEVDRYIARLAEHDPRVAHQQAKSQVYRIYRDTRFSPDKTPYKTYFSAAFQVEGRRDERAGYYLQMDNRPEEGGIYGGLWCPDAQELRKLRHAIVDNIDELRDILDEPELRRLYGERWCGPALKTAPAGWPKDHPCIELLRLKSYGKFHSLPPEFFSRPDWPEEAADRTAPLRPLIDFINYSLDESTPTWNV
ncbi:MAG: DUF2461 domain-containing protein [Muribaculaceae bacterium]|nr:DUF2461 domain-containing protein [Muribaculaceae bacterium]